MYTIAETRWGCEIGCVTRANARKYTRQARLHHVRPTGPVIDGQLWKSVYLRRRLNATLVDAMNQPNDVAPYRFFYERCMRFKPKGDVRAAFESVGITPEVLAVLVKPGAIPGNRVACAWACEAYPNSGVPRAGCRATTCTPDPTAQHVWKRKWKVRPKSEASNCAPNVRAGCRA